ncbi:hypothetical protein J4455_04140 [Candidatus Woesearchaeota archaeon]|nr:hypothetical protein [Candidatus Woesearchaeota archaeon]
MRIKRGFVYTFGISILLKSVYAAEFKFGVQSSPAKQNFMIILLLVLLVLFTFYIIYKISRKGKKQIKKRSS